MPTRDNTGRLPGEFLGPVRTVGTAGASSFDINLVRKYSVPGPRYTSYPTALQFSEDFPREALINEIRAGASLETPLSLYFHLPFCDSNCWFCGCTKIVSRDHSLADLYIDYLEREIALTAQLLNARREVVQMHFGGGTPTFLTPVQIRRLGGIIHEFFRFSSDAECSVEIDPRGLTREHLAALRETGCWRASLGVQDNDPVVQRAINRIQSGELTRRAVEWLRQEGFTSLNIDLICGLPHQTPESFSRTLEETLSFEPDRFAIFSYAHVPWIKPAQKIFDKQNSLPDPETKLAILESVVETLTAHGYSYIGMDHFAKAGDALELARKQGTLHRNFQGYSTKPDAEIFGFGMSAISQTRNTYRQNEKDLHAYYAALDKGILPLSKGYALTPEDHLRRETIMRLMCDLRLDFAAMSGLLGIDFQKHFAAEISSLEPLEKDGLLKIGPDGITVTLAGRFLIRNIAMRFDAYITEKENRFSRTV